jgi:nucleoside 2-deoxyribosyltransferase
MKRIKSIKSIYIIGSLRNPEVVKLGNALRKLGLDAFEDWAAPGKNTDDCWKAYEKKRGRTYGQALKGYAATHVFEFDKHHLDRTDAAVLLMPAGRSGHLELGYTIGRGKPGFILFPKEPTSRWDVMLQFATQIFFSQNDFLNTLAEKYVK